MSLSQGGILTLHVSPKNKSSDTIVRETGANSKIIIRLLDQEPVFKLYEHLMSKWNLSSRNLDIVFYCDGSRACLSDLISQYSQGKDSTKVCFDFDLIPSEPGTVTEPDNPTPSGVETVTPTTTASSTPVPGSPIATATNNHPKEDLQHFLALPPPPAQKQVVSDPLVPITTSNRKTKTSGSRVKSKPPTTSVVDDITTAPPEMKNHEPLETPPDPAPMSALILPPAPPSTILTSPVTADRLETVYREMLDRERDIFMSMLDCQARWMSQMQTQMVNACIAVQENAFRYLGRGGGAGDNDSDGPEFKKQRKQ